VFVPACAPTGRAIWRGDTPTVVITNRELPSIKRVLSFIQVISRDSLMRLSRRLTETSGSWGAMLCQSFLGLVDEIRLSIVRSHWVTATPDNSGIERRWHLKKRGRLQDWYC
jgi:hypothetical protein